MLEITITKNHLYFENLTDEQHTEIKKHFPDLEESQPKGHKIYGNTDKLFKVLYELSFIYDIEIK